MFSRKNILPAVLLIWAGIMLGWFTAGLRFQHVTAQLTQQRDQALADKLQAELRVLQLLQAQSSNNETRLATKAASAAIVDKMVDNITETVTNHYLGRTSKLFAKPKPKVAETKLPDVD